MGLFGALFAGVSGLDSQSNKIGIISNNISNVNTVGFKQGQAAFDTLVVPSGTTTFSPGGVIGTNQQLVNQQGLIQATTSSTDVAITGGGMLFVSTSAAGGANNLLFTRAGSFTQDQDGNFVNGNKLFLQGWAIDPNTGNPNTSVLETVNVSSGATGKPTPTTSLTFGANLDANQSALLGPGRTVALTGNDNVGINASQIIVGNDYGQNSLNSIVRGDKFSITNNSGSVPDVFTYGGISIGRDVTATINGTTTTGNGDGTTTLDSESIAGSAITNTGGTKVITVSVAHVEDYQSGHISLSGASAINGIPASEINGEHAIASVSGAGPGAGTVTFTVTTTGSGVTNNPSTTPGTVANRSYTFAGNILDAKSTTDDFLGITGTSPFATSALNFSIQVANVGTTTLTYSANPDPTTGKFNSLSTLVTAINDAKGSGLTASIVNGRINIAATNGNDAVTFVPGNATGNSTGAGIDWTQELDLPSSALPNINAGATGANSTAHFFNSLNGLAQAINSVDPNNLVAVVNNPTGSATLSINEANAQQTIAFADGGSNTGSLLQEFGFQNLSGSPLSTGTIPITYDPTKAKTDMSSGAVAPQFSKDIQIFDSLGKSHTIAINVAKLDTATGLWAVELTAVPPGDVSSANGGGTSGDGQIISGTVQFDGNGALTQVSSSLINPITITWNQTSNALLGINGGANPSTIKLDLSGMTQAAGAFSVSTESQNGTPSGQLTGVNIDQNGFVIASFSNGQTQKQFQIPLANFSNPNGLEPVSGDAYQATLTSGPINPVAAGTSGVGTFTPSALEQSNVDLSTQLTNLIVAQQAYGANSKVLTIADQLLQQLDQIIQ